MAGVKYICLDCGATAWMPRKPSGCIACDSARFVRMKVEAITPRQCEVCKKEFKPIRPTQKTCGDECRDIRRYKADYAARGKISLGSARCKFCGSVFKKKSHNQEICAEYKCQLRRVNENNAKKRKRDADVDLLGPEFPEMPMRKCHEKGCNEMTYDYRCDGCKEKIRGYAPSLSSLADLFRGGYMAQVGAGVQYG